MNELKAFLFGVLAFSASAVFSSEDTILVHDLVFEDERFENCVTNDYNSNTSTLAKDIRSLRCDDESIESVVGIEQFPNLEELNVGFNKLTILDLSANTELTELQVYGNALIELDISANTKLRVLDVANNQLKTLNTSANTVLVALDAHKNQLTTLDLSANTALSSIYISNNQLIDLDVTENTKLYQLKVSHNKITSLDLSTNANLDSLFVSNNQLSTIRFRDVRTFKHIDIRRNPFSIDTKEHIKTLSILSPVLWGPYESLYGLIWDGNSKDWEKPNMILIK